jgi:hypothetical protein
MGLTRSPFEWREDFNRTVAVAMYSRRDPNGTVGVALEGRGTSIGLSRSLMYSRRIPMGLTPSPFEWREDFNRTVAVAPVFQARSQWV